MEVAGSPADAFAQLLQRAVGQAGPCEGAGDVVADAAVLRCNAKRPLCLGNASFHLPALHERDREEGPRERVVRVLSKFFDACVDASVQRAPLFVGASEHLVCRLLLEKKEVAAWMPLQDMLQDWRWPLRPTQRHGDEGRP